jgi:hypothetical protein
VEITGLLVCIGVVLLPVLLLDYVYIRRSRDKSIHPADKVGEVVFPGDNPEVIDTQKNSYSLSEEIRKLWKYN